MGKNLVPVREQRGPKNSHEADDSYDDRDCDRAVLSCSFSSPTRQLPVQAASLEIVLWETL